MNKVILSILSVIAAVLCLSAQNADRPNIYKRTVFIDNIELGTLDEWKYENIPTSLRGYYSSFVDFPNKNLKKSKIAEVYQERDHSLDTENNKLLYVSKKAGSGYLAINKKLSAWISESDKKISYNDIKYIINEDEVISEKQILKLIKLRKKDLSSIIINSKNNIIRVEIVLL